MRLPLIVLLSVSSLLLFTELHAQSVIRGGGIGYRTLDSSSYEVSAHLLIQCTSSGTYVPEIECLVGNDTLLYDTLWLESVSDVTGMGKNCQIASRCQGDTSTPYGMEQHIYKAIFKRKPNSSCDMVFFLEGGQRAGTITTGQANQSFYIDTYLNHCHIGGQANIRVASPFLDNLTYCYNHDLVMANGLSTSQIQDSLSYSLTNARVSKNTSCNYSGNFSPIRPFNFFGFPNQNLQWPAGLRLDPITGDLLFRPTNLQQIGTVVIETSVWRKINGVSTVVARVRNEKVIHIISCTTNKTPKILPPFSKQICAGERACIQIRTDDDDNDDTVRISWNSAIPGATFTQNNGMVKHAQGEVCWTPDSSFISNIPYTFMVRAEDDNCPLAGKASRAFSFFVREPPRGTSAQSILACGFMAVSASPLKSFPGLNIFYFARDSNGTVAETGSGLADTLKLQPGRHIIETQFYAYPCNYSIYDTVDIPHYFIPTISYSDSLCFADSFQLFVNVSDTGSYTSQWTWKGSSGTVNMGDLGFYTKLPLSNSQEIIVRLTDTNGCYNVGSVKVLADNVRLPVNRNYTVCEGGTVQIGNTQSFQGTYLWNTWSTTATIPVSEKGTYWLQLNYPHGCSSRDTILVKEQANPIVQLPGYQVICSGSPVQVSLSGFTNSYTFRWSIDNIPFGPNSPSLSFIPSTLGILGIEVISPEGCSGNAFMPYDVYEIPLNIPKNQFQACSDEPVEIGIDDDFLGLIYQWNTGETTKKILVDTSGTYWIKTSDPYGCNRTDTFTVQLENPEISFPDTLLCKGFTDYLTPSVTGNRPFQYLWSNLSTDSAITALPGLISLKVTDYYGCTTYVEQIIDYAPRPVQAFLDTAVCQGTYLNAISGADSILISSFSWTDQWGGLYFMPGLSGLKKLVTLTKEGCRDTFNYDIQVNNRPIPAFTWYSDGNTFYFTAIGIEPQNRYTYDFGDSSFGYYPNSVKSYTKNGTYPVTLLVMDTSTACAASRKFMVDAYSLSNPEVSTPGIRVFPNPFTQKFTLNRESNCTQISNVHLINSLGQTVYSGTFPKQEMSILIDLSNYRIEKGVYFLSISCDETVQRIKLVKE